MTTAPARSVHPVRAAGTANRTAFPDDQLYMLKLTLELQLEALLLALGSSAVAARTATAPPVDVPWEKWLAEDLELACALTRDCVEDGVPLPSSMAVVGTGGGVVESLAARYSAMAAVVDEMLARTDAVGHPVAVVRLGETRARCEERLDALLGESPEAAAERLFSPQVAGNYLG